MHVDFSGSFGLILGAILWGTLHGLTPHGHSWLVLLPFALGGVKTRGMLRMALAYGAGMVVAAAGTGALLGLLHELIPESWRHGVEAGIGVLLIAVALIFLLRPLSVHHAIDHICSEECHSGEEKSLLRSGTTWAMFTLGVMSMLVPCPTNVWVFMLPMAASSAWTSALVFTIYALFTGTAVLIIAVLMVRARTLVVKLEERGYRLVIWRLSGLIILGVGIWILLTSLTGHGYEHKHRLEEEMQHENQVRRQCVLVISSRPIAAIRQSVCR